MLLLILLAVYSPKICNCYSPIYHEPKSCKPSHPTRRHADSRITELHFVQSEQCRTGVARCEGSHFYETPNGGTSNQSPVSQSNNAPPLPPSQLHSSQEMQATFHVVVHSRNGGGVSQTVHKVTNETTTTPIPHAATVTPVNSSNNNSSSVCCVYAPVRKKSKGNLYTEDKINFQPQPHYQRVVGPPRVAKHLLQHPGLDEEDIHEKLLNDSLGEDSNSQITSHCSTLPSDSKLTPSWVPLSYSRTLPLTPLERKDETGASISCGDISDDDLDSIYANIASLEDVQKQTTL
ncbi:hypothetical protein HOLleu_32629 [Holothuria leucospilota]|uniref:Uncharacterized protein n=1 Tax=Holothuria leucospilota TaxID=206669 RepID=A0A9Q1BIZ5_HOLLE|nr:hypothetical protein HOLleu_32629 [Holothuria leucospilota]